MSSRAWRISSLSPVPPGQDQTRTGIPSRVTAIPTMTWGQVVAVILAVAVGAKPLAGGGIRVVGIGASASVLVVSHRLVGVVDLDIGAGRVEEQQVHLKIEQVGDPVVGLLRQRGSDLQQPVPRPVAGL